MAHFTPTDTANYTTATQTFPRNLFASMFNFAPRDYFHIDQAVEGTPPKVEF